MTVTPRVTRWAVVVLSVLAFAPGLGSPLTSYDDPMYLAQNTTPGLDGFLSVWSSARAWSGQFIEFFPLRDAVYWLIFQQWGLTSWPYHVVSLLFHVLASLLAYELVRRVTPSPWVASATALLFAVHPMHSESVTWVAGLKDPMYLSLMLGSLLALVRYRERRDALSWALIHVCLVAALLVKSMALSTVLLMVAVERLVGTPTPWREVFKRVMPAALISALFVVQFVGISRAYGMTVGPHGGTWLSHWVLMGWAQVVYAKQALVPVSTRLVHCFVPPESWLDPRALASVAFVLAVVALAWLHRKHPLRRFWLAWYFACLAPVSNLYPFPAVVADRYLYAASLGVCWWVAEVLEARLPRLQTLLLGLVVTVMTVTLMFRSSVWNYPDELWVEPDEDPACLIDPENQALEAHLRRFTVDPTSDTGLAALERAVKSAALRQRSKEEYCGIRITLTMAELRRQRLTQAAENAEAATRVCPERADGWYAALAVTQHRNLVIARKAAKRLQALAPSVENAVGAALAEFEAEPSETAAQAVRQLMQSPDACAALGRWLSGAPPVVVESLEGARQRCSPAH